MVIRDNDILFNEIGVLCENSELKINKNWIEANKLGGVFLKSINGEIRGNFIKDSVYYGMVLSTQSHPRISGNEISKIIHTGLWIKESSNPHVIGNTISSCCAGIGINNNSHPRIIRNAVSNCSCVGISVLQDSEPRIIGNTLRDNKEIGLSVQKGLQVTLQDNDIQGSAEKIVFREE